MQYHPKLKMAMNEIMGILSRHDLAAIIVLNTPGHTEFLMKIDPSYSCAKVEGDILRVKAKIQEDFGGDVRAWEKKVSETSGMLHGLSEVGGKLILNLCEVSDMVDKKIGAEHIGGGFTSHTTQNN